MASTVQRLAAALLIITMLVPGVSASAAKVFENTETAGSVVEVDLSAIKLPESAWKDSIKNLQSAAIEAEIAKDKEAEKESVEESDKETVVGQKPVADASMAGMSIVLDQYFAVEGDLSLSAKVEIESITNPEVAAKVELMKKYENLGVAVVDSYLNVREEPHAEGRIIGKMVNNSACSILGEVDGWYHIKSGEVSGYVSSAYIVTGEEAMAIAMEDAALRARVNTEELNVRKGPGVEYEAITQITTNERYEVVGEENGWTQIALASGETAYVASHYVVVEYSLLEAVKFEPISAATQFRLDVVNYALQFLGNPYVWGGTNPWTGADCSGYMQSVMATFGITLPRVSWQQAGAGAAVSLENLQPGDLVFYGAGGKVNHVAMYIGNGQIVHAISESRGIGITSMWVMSPMGFRNVIGE